ncbi:30S ribosomal protein S6 [bacterium]|nr:30S ribosomal protein S6 [bacterium]
MATTQNTYELTYIVNSVISDEQVKDLISRVTAYISEAGGEIIEVDEWGQRRLAYPIQKKRNGYYVNMYFLSTGTIVPRLERALEIDDNVLRYMTLRMDAKMIRHYEESKTRRAAILAADPTLPSDNDDEDED